MTDPRAGSPLPLPRLVLNLGGLGNRQFGPANGIADDEAALLEASATACDAVWTQLEATLKALHQAEQPDVRRHLALEGIPWWKSHALAWLFFGQADRWGWRRRVGQPAGVFSPEPPLVRIFTGGEPGGDTLIRDTALARPTASDGGVRYQHRRIAPEPPGAVPDGLGVGAIPAQRADLTSRRAAGGGLPRAEAAELARIARRRAFGFRAQSEALRHHSDLLLAVWDPDAEGKAGGTSESVAAALQERIPVIAVRLRGPGAAEVHVLEEPNHLRALQAEAAATARPAENWREALDRVLRGILAFPDSPARASDSLGRHGAPTAYHPRVAFAAFREAEPLQPIWPARLWRVFEAFAKYRVARESARHGATTEEREVGERQTGGAREDLDARLHELFVRAPHSPPPPEVPATEPGDSFTRWYGRVKDRAASQGMSGIYGDAHRGGIIASYLLAAVAVLMALGGGILHALDAPVWFQAIVAAAEVAAILVMFGLAVCSQAEDWHAAYTDSRILAEALRMMEFLGPLGVHTPLPRLPHYLRGAATAPPPEALWTMWYFRTLVRMAPLRLRGGGPAGDLTAGAAGLRRTAIEGQTRYHRANATKQRQLHHDIEQASLVLFGIVIACATLHLVGVLIHWHWTPFVIVGLVACVGGPALIAALHGLASQVENSRLEQRSASMVRLLGERAAALEALDLATDPDSAEAVWGLAIEALATASLLMDETADWSLLYRNTDIHAG